MSAKSTNAETIVIGLMVRTARLVQSVSYQGKQTVIVGKQARIMPILAPTIEMLTEECNPRDPIIRSDAEANFQEAAEKLLSEGKTFYTVARHGWNLPALEWSRL